MLPFWKPEEIGEQIEGLATEARSITGNYGESVLMNIGDFAVNVTAGLGELPKQAGKYIRLTYLGEMESQKTGRLFKDFKIEVSDV